MNATIATRISAIVGMTVTVTVTAAGCSTANKNAPDQTGVPSTPASSSAGPTLTESEKVLSTTGPIQFAPSEKAQPAPTALPGRHGRQ